LVKGFQKLVAGKEMPIVKQTYPLSEPSIHGLN
jgi:hypothetical protein